ncbi:4Fe-4S dicluster domain-containing protein [Megasphaera stantonii]|uniref:4Fe-4S dicluster domain-containing protein n=1 Tax=Megasphaera stantonii TaxID=2144175 RepID=UPI001DC902C3|nr:4Fe-4S dicluster domain-containing protein [Megasphaera stantonii]HJE83918.1 2Fe-2S iron-sulfur cluster-binding protein [Megasphaera stantonii]
MTAKHHMVTLHILGKRCTVPEDLTIMRAMEYAGFRLVRGCGCRSGFCGACAVVYRIQGETKLYSALACQTKVEEGMCVGRLESFPINKKDYDINNLPLAGNVVGQFYPEIYNCIHCNACTKSCPQGINVMKYIALAQRGDYEGCAEESFRCVACDICASRCPVKISHSAVSLMVRRLTGRYIAKKSVHLDQRVQDIEAGLYDEELERLMHLSDKEIHRLYEARDMER